MLLPLQTDVAPKIGFGVTGAETGVTVLETAPLLPHKKLLRKIFTSPDEPLLVAAIEFVVLEPVQPIGSSQL